jgi:haloalkane dehalogenase
MEGLVRPFTGWDEFIEAATPIFQAFRSDEGESMILDRNLFIERVLPGSVIQSLSEAEMTEYRKPLLNREDRWPTLTWPRQIPIAGEPADVNSIVDAYASWMSENQIPKLFINADPGRPSYRCWTPSIASFLVKPSPGRSLSALAYSWRFGS